MKRILEKTEKTNYGEAKDKELTQSFLSKSNSQVKSLTIPFPQRLMNF